MVNIIHCIEGINSKFATTWEFISLKTTQLSIHKYRKIGHATHLAIDMKQHSLKVQWLDEQHHLYHQHTQLRLLKCMTP